jgi:GNAT superfamily N-acetyltransferase
MTYKIREVDASDEETADLIHEFNRSSDLKFPKLVEDELEGVNCFWWLGYYGDEPIAFAGMVPSRLYPNAGYLKRSGVFPEHRGNGLQLRFFRAREQKARKIGWTMLVSETVTENIHSANNFIRAGYRLFEPKEKWARDSIYWKKDI